MRVIDDGYMLRPEDENMGRDDAIRFVDERSAMLPVAAAMRRLKAIGDALQHGETLQLSKDFILLCCWLFQP